LGEGRLVARIGDRDRRVPGEDVRDRQVVGVERLWDVALETYFRGAPPTDNQAGVRRCGCRRRGPVPSMLQAIAHPP